MRSLFRSEVMAKCQLFLQSEAAYQCITELGELGRVQFQDLNVEVNAFQRKFVNDVRRCDEMQRMLAYVEKEIASEEFVTMEPEDPNVETPLPKDMIDMEAMFQKIEEELRQVNDNVSELTKNYVQLNELKHVLRSVDAFFENRNQADSLPMLESNTNKNESPSETAEASKDAQAGTLSGNQSEDEVSSNKDENQSKRRGVVAPEKDESVSFIAGTISVTRFQSFERLLWRVGRGIIFCHQVFIDEPMTDVDGKPVRKSVFIVFFPGEQLKQRVKRICDAFHANVYPCPSGADQRRESAIGVLQRIEDMKQVFNGSRDHRMKVLANAAKNIRSWKVQLTKMKSVFHIMNMLNVDVTQKCLIGECWIPEYDMVKVQSALRRGTEAAGSSFPCIINRIENKDVPPTFYKTNKFTNGFQNIVNAYGVGTYGELNPAPYAVITFPFLFAVMFGDIGHGLIMTLAALALIAFEKQLCNIREEIVATFFGGRFIILLMGMFSIYTGLIYNDFFSKSINIFGTSWILEWKNESHIPQHLQYILLAPETDFKNQSYTFGLDPIWMLSSNKIQFTNSYKMKMAVIVGLLQMSFGTFLSLSNALHFKDRTKFPPPRTNTERFLRRTLNIWSQFIPEIIFLLSLFGYLVFLIIYKWMLIFGNPEADSGTSDLRGAGCSRSLLMLFINLFLPSDSSKGPCYVRPLYESSWLVDKVILLIALCAVPWLLLAKPFYLMYLNSVHSKPLPPDFVPIVTQEERESTDDSASSSSSNSRRKKSTVSMHTLKGNEGQNSKELKEDRTSDDADREEFNLGDIFIHQIIHTIEYCLGAVSNTASYLRLWALSLAHAQLSEVLWGQLFGPVLFTDPGDDNPARMVISAVSIFLLWLPWAVLTVAILLVMEGLSAFLHALRLHWVEFMNKFFSGEGYLFSPFDFKEVIYAMDE